MEANLWIINHLDFGPQLAIHFFRCKSNWFSITLFSFAKKDRGKKVSHIFGGNEALKDLDWVANQHWDFSPRLKWWVKITVERDEARAFFVDKQNEILRKIFNYREPMESEKFFKTYKTSGKLSISMSSFLRDKRYFQSIWDLLTKIM